MKLRFLERIYRFVLDTNYFFITFTLPYGLRPYAKDPRNRRVVIQCLVRAVTDSLLSICKQHKTGFMPGIIVVVHTFNKQAQWHPHVHVLITAGGVPLAAIKAQKGLKFSDETMEGAWVSYDYFPEKQVRSRCMAKLMAGLRRTHKQGQLTFEADEPMADAKTWSYFLADVFEKGDYLHIRKDKKRNGVMTHCLEYALRYMGHPPLAISTLVYNEEKSEVLWTPQVSDGEKRQSVRLGLEDFVLRMVDHIPGKHDRTVFCYGLYANRQINQALKIAKSHPLFKDSDFSERMRKVLERDQRKRWAKKKHKQKPLPSRESHIDNTNPDRSDELRAYPDDRIPWQQRVKFSYGVDPLVCERCGHAMKTRKRPQYFSRDFCKTHILKYGQIIKLENSS